MSNIKEKERQVLDDNGTNSAVQKTALNGVDQDTLNKANSTFTASGTQTQAQNKANNQLSNYESIANKGSIVSGNTWDTINQSFKTPTAVTKADTYLKEQLSKIQSGKTSYSDEITNLMSQISNRDKFSYDVDNDPLFQQALASAMNSGKSAMQDTIGQASALTGGYGSSYATSAGNQAYNAYLEDAYNNLPQYYQMALDAYNAEGEEMYRQLDMYNTADATEYNRLLNAYDATGAYRDRLYNEAYQQFRDSKSDAFASANLQLSEHSQLSSDAYNLYSAYANEAEKMYEKEFQKWDAEVQNAMQMVGMQNSDWWKQKDYEQADEHFYKGLEHESAENQKDRDLTSSENALDREHDSAENQKNRDWQTEESQKDRDHQTSEREASQNWQSSENQLDREHETSEREASQNWQSSENQLDREHQSSENALNREHQSSENALDREHDKAMQDDAQAHDSSENALDRQHDASEGALDRAARADSSGSDAKPYKFTDSQINKIRDIYNEDGEDAMWEYVAQIGMTPENEEQADLLASIYMGAKGETPTTKPSNTGGISNFRTNKGDNFEISIGGNTYKVENHGKADDDTKKELDKIDVEDGSAFTYNGEIYVKYAGGYYLVGARAFGGGSYNDALAALK